MRRKKLKKSLSKRIFSKTAGKTHPLNLAGRLIQRGGIHLLVVFALAIGFVGCKFAMKDFNSSIGEVEMEAVNR